MRTLRVVAIVHLGQQLALLIDIDRGYHGLLAAVLSHCIYLRFMLLLFF